MFKHIPIPVAFSLTKKGKVSFLIKEAYKNLLLQKGIEDFEIFLETSRRSSDYLEGRMLHPSFPIREGERVILRQYLHGGLLQGINRTLFLFGSRSFQELALTEEIRSCGISTIEPIAAIHRFILWPFYQAYFLSLEIPHSKNLIQYFHEVGTHPSYENVVLKRKVIRSAGLLLRKFHQMGFFHGDLQLKNILVVRDQPFILDFDRSYRKKSLSVRERMRNLLRLNRSAEKWRRLGLPITRTDRLRFFLAYAGEDETIRRAMAKTMRAYSVRRLFYRFGWALENAVRR